MRFCVVLLVRGWSAGLGDMVDVVASPTQHAMYPTRYSNLSPPSDVNIDCRAAAVLLPLDAMLKKCRESQSSCSFGRGVEVVKKKSIFK